MLIGGGTGDPELVVMNGILKERVIFDMMLSID